MDRNTIIGLVLIAGIVLTWSIFFAGDGKDQTTPKPANPTENVSSNPTASGNTADVSSINAQKPISIADSVWAAMSDSTRAIAIANEKMHEHGDFSKLYEGQNQVVEVETDKFNLRLHSKGGRVGSLILKDYKTADGNPLPIQTDTTANFLEVAFSQKARVKYPAVTTADLYFQPNATGQVKVSGEESKSVSLMAKIDDGHFLEYVYTFKGNAWDYGLEIKQVGLNELLDRQAMSVNWQTEVPKTERTMELMRQKAEVYYRESGSVEDLGPTKNPEEPIATENRVDWIAFHSQFFTYTLLTEDESASLDNAKVWQMDPAVPATGSIEDGKVVKLMTASFELPIATSPAGSAKYKFFAGPLDYSTLSDYGRDMNQQIALGWGPLKYVNKWLTIPIFNFLEGFIGNYGLIILLLGIIIKTLIYPLTYRTYISTARMRVVNNTPEAKALEAKYKDDPTKLQQEKMGIYKQYGVSMFGGCWPMVVQYPFMIALFFFFPNAIQLRQQSFWWAPDLSTYDSIYNLPFSIPFYGDHVSLFTLLMTASIFGYTIINQKMQAQQVANPVMKWFPYIMPIFLLGFLNRYSAGLSWYYLLSNLISISQTLITRYFVSDDKIMADLMNKAKENAANPDKKKGTMERWAERQQQRQKDMIADRQEARGEAPASKGAKVTAPKKRR